MTVEQYAIISDYSMVSAMVVLSIAFGCHAIEWGLGLSKTHVADRLVGVAVSLTALATILLGIASLTRGLAAERVPWANMYEFGMVGAFIALLAYLIWVRTSGVTWLGLVVTGFSVTLLFIAKSTYVPAGPTVPALNSPWLIIHVAAVMIAGSFFLIGAAAAVLYLVRSRKEKQDVEITGFLARIPKSEIIDRISYRANAIAFPLWTFGALITGPIWADRSWGRFWGWDPKEVWALITWIVFAGYLHARATWSMKGKVAAWFCLVGFGTFLFSYYGINLFGSGLHSYAK